MVYVYSDDEYLLSQLYETSVEKAREIKAYSADFILNPLLATVATKVELESTLVNLKQGGVVFMATAFSFYFGLAQLSKQQVATQELEARKTY